MPSYFESLSMVALEAWAMGRPVLVNAACKLVDLVCSRQWLHSPIGGLRGAVAGSSPPWGGYMALRYPNWAAKFHADALVALEDRLRREMP